MAFQYRHKQKYTSHIVNLNSHKSFASAKLPIQLQTEQYKLQLIIINYTSKTRVMIGSTTQITGHDLK